MKSLDRGETPMRGVRVPDELWERVERWAATRGQGTSDSLRLLLEEAASAAPEHGLIVRPPMRWMIQDTYRHPCFQKRPRLPVRAHCDSYHHHPGDWIFVNGPAGLGTWWDLFSSVTSKRIGGHRGEWTRVPACDLSSIALAFRGQESRIRVHHLVRDDGPRLITGNEGE